MFHKDVFNWIQPLSLDCDGLYYSMEQPHRFPLAWKTKKLRETPGRLVEKQTRRTQSRHARAESSSECYLRSESVFGNGSA